MKVCHVIISLAIVGGAERMLARLVLAGAQSANESVVLVLGRAGALGAQLRSTGIMVHELGMDSGWRVPFVLFKLAKLIRLYKPDIVQTWMYHADLLGGISARIAGRNMVVWGVRTTFLSVTDSVGTVLLMKACAWLSRWIPDAIICVAEAARRAHIAVGYDPSRMVVIRNGFEFSHLTATVEETGALRRSCNFVENDVVVGCVGRFHTDKGQDNFVKAAALIARTQSHAKFLLVGRGCDANNTKLVGWLSEYGLRDRFTLLGERGDVPVCLSAMNVFCMPSRTEGFPNCLGEAMAMGLPCVATNVGDAEFLAGDAAILVPARDEKALARAILGVIELSIEQRHRLGQRAKARVLNEFSMDKACNRFESVYQELLSVTKS